MYDDMEVGSSIYCREVIAALLGTSLGYFVFDVVNLVATMRTLQSYGESHSSSV